MIVFLHFAPPTPPPPPPPQSQTAQSIIFSVMIGERQWDKVTEPAQCELLFISDNTPTTIGGVVTV